MNIKTFRLSLLFFLAFLISAPPCWAKAKGYLYVVGYSFSQKKAFFSPVIMQKVRSISYSDEEYVTEVELIQALESQFQEHMASSARINPSEYTVSAKGAYKKKEIAERLIQEQKERYQKKGYKVSVLKGFVYNDEP